MAVSDTFSVLGDATRRQIVAFLAGAAGFAGAFAPLPLAVAGVSGAFIFISRSNFQPDFGSRPSVNSCTEPEGLSM